MILKLTEFQRVNGAEDDLLPLYVDTKIITRKTIFLYVISILSFCITCIIINNFLHISRI
jgi:hypothetical protein